jgi:hypothetical protein
MTDPSNPFADSLGEDGGSISGPKWESEPWFFSNLSKADGAALVLSLPHGGFVVRPSSQAGAYALVINDSGLLQVRLVVCSNHAHLLLLGSSLIRTSFWWLLFPV